MRGTETDLSSWMTRRTKKKSGGNARTGIALSGLSLANGSTLQQHRLSATSSGLVSCHYACCLTCFTLLPCRASQAPTADCN